MKYRFKILLFFIIIFYSCTKIPVQKAQKLEKKESRDQISETLFTEGMKSYILGNASEALASFMKALEIAPENAAVNYMLGKLSFEQGKNDEAIAYLNRAIKSDGKNKFYYLFLAQIYEKKLAYGEAGKIYKKIVTDLPDSDEYNYDLAATYIYQNDFDEAIKIYNKIESIYGKSPEVSQQKQQIYIKVNKLELAIAESLSLIEAFPEETDFKVAHAELLYANNKVDDAIKVVEDILKDTPNDPKANRILSEIYKFQGNYGKAMDYLAILFKNPETDIDSKIKILEDIKKLPEEDNTRSKGLLLAETMIKAHPSDAKAYAAYGDMLYVFNKKEDAWKNYILAKNYDQGNYTLWTRVLLLDSEFNKSDSLIAHSEEALEFFPNQILLWFYNGTGHLMKNNYKSAIESLEEGKKLSKGNLEQLQQFNMQLGDAYNGIKNYEKSDEAFDDVLKYDIKNAHVLNNYSYFLALRKDKLEKAREMASKLVSDYPTEASYLDTYAWVLYMLKDYQMAKNLLETAVMDSKSGTILEHFGDILYQLGQKEKAVEYWKKGKALGETSDFIDRKIKEQKLYE